MPSTNQQKQNGHSSSSLISKKEIEAKNKFTKFIRYIFSGMDCDNQDEKTQENLQKSIHDLDMALAELNNVILSSKTIHTDSSFQNMRK